MDHKEKLIFIGCEYIVKTPWLPIIEGYNDCIKSRITFERHLYLYIYIYGLVKIGDSTYKSVESYDLKTLWDTLLYVPYG